MAERILILGASYGSLLGAKLAMTGRDVTLVCLPDEASLINANGVVIRLPVRGRDGLVEIGASDMSGAVSAAGPGEVDPADFDMIGLAMQEPQYSSPGVRDLLAKIAASGKPCISIMNMPPLPFLARIPGMDARRIENCYREPKIWSTFYPGLVTLASPDPQAFRPPEEPANVLQVSLPTNFKVARFEDPAHTDALRAMEADIDGIRHDPGDGPVELPVKLRVHESIYVPLAKWCMLLTGNYRCVTADGPRSIKDAVHSNLATSRFVYDWVGRICQALGADEKDLVPFEKYAKAAEGLVRPSSAARALFAGAPNIERVDRLVRTLSEDIETAPSEVQKTVDLVDELLAKNQAAAA